MGVKAQRLGSQKQREGTRYINCCPGVWSGRRRFPGVSIVRADYGGRKWVEMVREMQRPRPVNTCIGSHRAHIRTHPGAPLGPLPVTINVTHLGDMSFGVVRVSAIRYGDCAEPQARWMC